MSKAIFGFSFGKPRKNVGINFANIAIAEFCKKNSQVVIGTKIFHDASILINNANSVIIGKNKPDVHESTIELLEKALPIFQKENINEVCIVAAKPHIWRVIRDAKKILIDINVYTMPIDNIRWFQPDSTQIFTRHAWIWWPREIILRLLPFKFYCWLTKKLA